ncbi:hypothetical protein ACHAXS_004511, partial [Conticribra weissflogii]
HFFPTVNSPSYLTAKHEYARRTKRRGFETGKRTGNMLLRSIALVTLGMHAMATFLKPLPSVLFVSSYSSTKKTSSISNYYQYYQGKSNFRMTPSFLVLGGRASSQRAGFGVTQKIMMPINSYHSRHHVNIHKATNAGENEQSAKLTMDNIYFQWTIEEDRQLYDNRHLSTIRLASLLGRGMHGVEARLKKLSDVNSSAYARLFGVLENGNSRTNSDKEDTALVDETNNSKLTPVKEVLRRIRWDPTLPSSDFTVIHYDRVDDTLCETPFDASNDSISGKERRFVFALPEHRIQAVKFRERVVWDKDTRMDCVFGSMNGNGITIDVVVENYDDWKREHEQREERNRIRQVEVLREMDTILGNMRVNALKEMSSNLVRSEWDVESVKKYAKSVVALFYDARDGMEMSRSDENDELVHFLHLFSDLVALLPEKKLKEAILKEIEVILARTSGNDETAKNDVNHHAHDLPELNEIDLEEKFVKGSGAGGQKINKTSNKVILIHIPTRIRVECQVRKHCDMHKTFFEITIFSFSQTILLTVAWTANSIAPTKS